MSNVPDEIKQRVEVARDYRKARIYHSLREYAKARLSYCQIFFAADLKMKMKLIVLLLLTLCKR